MQTYPFRVVNVSHCVTAASQRRQADCTGICEPLTSRLTKRDSLMGVATKTHPNPSSKIMGVFTSCCYDSRLELSQPPRSARWPGDARPPRMRVHVCLATKNQTPWRVRVIKRLSIHLVTLTKRELEGAFRWESSHQSTCGNQVQELPKGQVCATEISSGRVTASDSARL